MSNVRIDDALEKMRSWAQQIYIFDEAVGADGLSGLQIAAVRLADQFIKIDQHLLRGGGLPKDWEIDKTLTWIDGLGGSKVLKFNGKNVGHVIPEGGITWQADLKPTPECPYLVESKFNSNVGSLESAMVECEVYVRDQTKNVFDPWVALKNEGLI